MTAARGHAVRGLLALDRDAELMTLGRLWGQEV
jgi:hypothetical protein